MSLALRTTRNSDSVGGSDVWRNITSPRRKIAVAIARELAGFLWGRAATSTDTREKTPRRTFAADWLSNGTALSCDGARRRRMIRGTIARIGGDTMRQGPRPEFALVDCPTS